MGKLRIAEILPFRLTSVEAVIPGASSERRQELGQYMTPPVLADFIASFFTFTKSRKQDVHLLDAGAGAGALSCAFARRHNSELLSNLKITAYEIDSMLANRLEVNLRASRVSDIAIHREDYLARIDSEGLKAGSYTHAILNPPYRKIGSKTKYQRILKGVGIETVNLYTAFVAVALSELSNAGHLVAIIPRSFCNGPYHKMFREYVLSRAAIRRIHLFNSRTEAFSQDRVLQENVILHLQRDVPQEKVIISYSTDSGLTDLSQRLLPFVEIVRPQDEERFIRIPLPGQSASSLPKGAVGYSLRDLGLQVSTGPVVGFRVKDALSDEMGFDAVPLFYGCHFKRGRLFWPLYPAKKPNFLLRGEKTERWMFPAGNYCVVRRFSSKEEKRRVVASVVEKAKLENFRQVGFENRLNVFHQNRKPLSEALAFGLAAFLNTSQVERYFRSFSGHTQVNATDLRNLDYPSRVFLEELGGWSRGHPQADQTALDAQFLDMMQRKN